MANFIYSLGIPAIAPNSETQFVSEKVLEELKQINSTLVQNVDLNCFLLNPIITTIDKKDVIDKVFVDFSDNTKNFLYLLVEKNRFSHFESIFETFVSFVDERNNVKSVEIISAVELYDDEKNRLVDKLQRKLSCVVRPTYVIDETILAGLIIKIGDKVVDNSLKTRFAGLKRQLI